MPDSVKVRIWLRDRGMCGICGLPIMKVDLEYDHIIALCNGGQHSESNQQCVHTWCHTDKTKTDLLEHARSARKRRRYLLGPRKARRPMPGSRASAWKKTFSSGWVRR